MFSVYTLRRVRGQRKRRNAITEQATAVHM